jgi:hypothetical protein
MQRLEQFLFVRRFQWGTLLALLCLFVPQYGWSQQGASPCIPQPGLSQPIRPNTAQIINLMTNTVQSSNPYLVISAHRGYWKFFPENSTFAFSAAASLGVDALEIDVSDTSDRRPVLMHDTDISRTTNYSGSNGDIHQTTYANFSGLYLRDRHGCVTIEQTSSLDFLFYYFTHTQEGLPQSVLNWDGSTLTGPAIVVDIKDRRSDALLYQTLMDAIKYFKMTYTTGSPYRAAVIFKVPMRVMPQGSGGPQQFASDVAGQTGDSYVPQMIYVKFPDDPLPGAAPTDASNVGAADPTFSAYINDSHTLHVETNEKYLNDTMTPYRNYLSIAGRAIAGYSPENFFPEGQPHSGKCCTTEDTYYSQGSASNQSSPQPGCFSKTSPTPCLDLTGRWDFLVDTQMTVMTVERVDDALQYASTLGRRSLP